MNKNKEDQLRILAWDKKKSQNGGDIQTVQCCLTKHPIYVLNSNMSLHLVKDLWLKKILWPEEIWFKAS